MAKIYFPVLIRYWLLSCLGIAVMNMAGCNGVDKAHWTEEVRLHDGRLIVVERWARAYHSGFPNSPRGSDIDYDLAYSPMNIRWHGVVPRAPVSFDIFNGTPYLALYAEGLDFCQGKDPQHYAAQFFRWNSGQWVEITQEQFPVDGALMNLDRSFWGSTDKDDPRGLVNWREKAGRNSYYPDKPDTVRSWYETHNRFCKSR